MWGPPGHSVASQTALQTPGGAAHRLASGTALAARTGMKDHSIRWFALCLAVGYGIAGCKSRNAPEGSVTVTSENGSVTVGGDKGSVTVQGSNEKSADKEDDSTGEKADKGSRKAPSSDKGAVKVKGADGRPVSVKDEDGVVSVQGDKGLITVKNGKVTVGGDKESVTVGDGKE